MPATKYQNYGAQTRISRRLHTIAGQLLEPRCVASSQKHILLVGATGVVGRATLQHFSRLPASEWKITALSRRKPDFEYRGAWYNLDLMDSAKCTSLMNAIGGDVTHCVYGALYEKPNGLLQSWTDEEQIEINGKMLKNIMEPLLVAAKDFQHLSVMQGAKAYRMHLRGMEIAKLPYKERQPRMEHRNFYWLQEDYIKAKQREFGHKWYWTIWRPPIIIGYATSSPLNVLAPIGAYIAILRELGEPLTYPGGVPMVTEVMDSGLIARGFAWAATSPQARDEHFNITNGDNTVMDALWPSFATFFGMPLARNADYHKPIRLGDYLGTAEAEAAWQQVVQKHGLHPSTLKTLCNQSADLADMLLNAYSAGDTRRRLVAAPLMSTIKLRQAGFGDCVDTEDMFLRWFGQLQDEKNIA